MNVGVYTVPPRPFARLTFGHATCSGHSHGETVHVHGPHCHHDTHHEPLCEMQPLQEMPKPSESLNQRQPGWVRRVLSNILQFFKELFRGFFKDVAG